MFSSKESFVFSESKEEEEEKKWIAAGGWREGVANRGVEEGRRNRFGERIKNCSSLRTSKNRGRSGEEKRKKGSGGIRRRFNRTGLGRDCARRSGGGWGKGSSV